MTEQEETWMKKLHDVNANLVKAHDNAKTPIENWFSDEKDLYSDTAHFVYELLQNADDAGSSSARFILYGDKLVFAHSGEGIKRFTISSFENKEVESGTSDYGSVNALTDRNGTTKKDDNEKGNAIGKFGRGFKSVYGYTSTPSVYDENLRFRIERIIIPVDLSKGPDCPERQDGETLFVLPFNRKGMTQEQAVTQIKTKLKDLVMPTLFLRNLKKISFKLPDGIIGCYEKNIKEYKDYGNGDKAKLIEMSFQLNGEVVRSRTLWVFSRKTNCNHEVSVGYFINQQDGSLDMQPQLMPAFCFFPTRHETGLNFLIQAPFRLTATRERIKDEVSEPHNGNMIKALAELAASSIEYLRDLKDITQRSLLTDDIIDVIPTRSMTKEDYIDCLDLSPFAEKMLAEFKVARVIPTKSGIHVISKNAYWPDSKDISDVFPEEQLQSLFGNADAKWAFTSRWNDRQRESKWVFLKNLELKQGNASSILKPEVLTVEFMRNQSIDWLLKLHDWIAADRQQYGRRYLGKSLPIFINQNQEPICPYADGRPRLLKPGANGGLDIRADRTVLMDFLRNEGSRNLLDFYQAHEPSRVDDIEMILDQEWDAELKEEHLAAFKIVYEEIGKLNENERRTVIEKLKGKKFLAVDARGENPTCKLCNELYFPSAELKSYFSPQVVKFLDINAYEDEVGEEDRRRIVALMETLGVAELPRKISVTYQGLGAFDEEYRGKNWSRARPNGVNEWKEDEFEGMLHLINILDAENLPNGKDVSLAVWNILTKLVQRYGEGNFLNEVTHTFLPPYKVNPRSETGLNYLLHRLQSAKWLLSRDGSWVSAKTSNTQSIQEFYGGHSPGEIALRNIIGLKDNETTEVLEALKKINPTWEAKLRSIMAEEDATARNKDNKPAHNENKRVNTEGEEFLALDEDIKVALGKVQGQPTNQSTAIDVLGDKKAMVITIPQLFSMKLRIPDYQRPYKWGKDNVWDFMDDIKRMVVDKVEGADGWKAHPYRMGSIILHRDEEGNYNIVDGQQRTLTFVLLALAVGVSCDCLNDKNFYPALSQMPVSRRNLNNNLRYITDWLKMHGGDCKAQFSKALEVSLQVVVVCVDKQDYAFQLFDSQNIKGRRLEPHDLLKAYHLRELDEDISLNSDCYENVGHETKDPRLQVVTQWENFDVQDLSYLFDKLLYPILKWSEKEKCYGFTTKDLKAFKGVPQRWRGKYGYVDNAFAAVGKFRIGTEFAPGKEFFDMVLHYQVLLKNVREKAGSCPMVKQILENGSNNAYIKALFESVLMAYFDRFGLRLPSEDVNAAINTLCKWVYSARLDLEYFSPKTPNKYALGVVDGSSNYTNRIAMFFAIRNAVFHTDIAKMAVEMSKTTKESQRTDARKSLWDLVNAL